MNYTKEYIELCKNKKIQDLKPNKNLEIDDIVVTPITSKLYIITENRNGCLTLINRLWGEINKYSTIIELIWLPREEQLDEEIIKICQSKNYDYQIYYAVYSTKSKDRVWEISVIKDTGPAIEMTSPNPLVAKIELLIELLEEK